jgi:hypothetical protein
MSKNVKVNNVDYNEISTVTLQTTEGGTATFKDVDEIVIPSGTKQVTENGTYDISEFANVNVKVSSGDVSPTYQEKTITSNGTYMPDSGFDAFNKVVVNVPTGGGSGGTSNAKMAEILSRTVTSLDANDFSGVTELGGYAFTYCKMLTSVVIPSTVTKLHTNSFSYCDVLTSVSLPEGLTKIGDNSFSQCKALSSIEIPSTIATIEGSVFAYCLALTSVVFKGAITKILASAFTGCTALALLDFSHCTSVPTLSDTTKVFANVPKNCMIKIPSALASAWQSDEKWAAWGFTNYVTV